MIELSKQVGNWFLKNIPWLLPFTWLIFKDIRTTRKEKQKEKRLTSAKKKSRRSNRK